MSDVALVALITGSITGVVGLAGLGLNFWNSWRERDQRLAERREDYRDWYRRTLFEKRVTAAQEGYRWLMRLNGAMNIASPTDPACQANQELRQLCLDAREWYDSNALFLYDALPKRSSFIGLTNAAGVYAQCVTKNDLRIWDSHAKATQEIRDRLQELLSAERGRRSNGDG